MAFDLNSPGTVSTDKTTRGAPEETTPKNTPAASSTPGGRWPSVYTMMLVLTLLFLIVASGSLVYEMSLYEYELRPNYRIFP